MSDVLNPERLSKLELEREVECAARMGVERALDLRVVYASLGAEMERAVAALWALGEKRYAEALASRLVDVERQARRHMSALVRAHTEKQGETSGPHKPVE